MVDGNICAKYITNVRVGMVNRMGLEGMSILHPSLTTDRIENYFCITVYNI